jgi:two-component system response regulator PilR (NtrC family)
VSKSLALAKEEQENYKVLVVDDNHHMRQILCEFLKDQGYSITTVKNGEDAIDVLSAHHFDIVLTDLNMGQLNGIDVLKKTKELSPHTPVIITTGNSDVTYVIEALRYNADDYILKPFRMTDLLERMSICLERISPPYLQYRSQREQ